MPGDDRRVVDWQELGIHIERQTRCSSVAGVHVDVFTFTKPDGHSINSYVTRKNSAINRTSGETLAEAIRKIEEVDDVKIVNPPKRVHKATKKWVTVKELWQDVPE